MVIDACYLAAPLVQRGKDLYGNLPLPLPSLAGMVLDLLLGRLRPVPLPAPAPSTGQRGRDSCSPASA